MSEREQIAAGLRKAIQAEGDGYHFYKMAAVTTEDPQGREVFEGLAEEELEHRRYLERQYHSVVATGRFDTGLTLHRRVDLAGDSPIFSAALRARARDAHFEMSALSIGVQLELNAVKFYEAEAARATEPSVKAFYEDLAQWEKGHYDALLRQQEALKEDYWADSGFSPF